MSSARRCACTVIFDASSDLPIPLKLENVPRTLGDDPLALAMRSDGEAEQQSRRSEPGVVPLRSLLLPLSLRTYFTIAPFTHLQYVIVSFYV